MLDIPTLDDLIELAIQRERRAEADLAREIEGVTDSRRAGLLRDLLAAERLHRQRLEALRASAPQLATIPLESAELIAAHRALASPSTREGHPRQPVDDEILEALKRLDWSRRFFEHLAGHAAAGSVREALDQVADANVQHSRDLRSRIARSRGVVGLAP